MKEESKSMFTHSLNPMKDDIYVSIGYISNFVGISSVRLHEVLKGMKHKHQGKTKIYPFGRIIRFLLEKNTFKYSKNLTHNGKKMRKLQKGKK